MPFRLSVQGNVLYVSWRGFTEQDLRDVATKVADLHRAHGGRIVYLARIPAGGDVLNDAETATLQRFLHAVLPHCEAIHHVLEGGGFLQGARRALFQNLARSTPRPRDFHSHDTLEAAREAIASLHHASISALRTIPPAAPPIQERASGAFRAAARMVERRDVPPHAPGRVASPDGSPEPRRKR